ncbi:MAG: hypothetical protein HRT72_06585 [Flavobacteriales bacterium]|nr:hypothetical protein [Flavobacteriales bacterium]
MNFQKDIINQLAEDQLDNNSSNEFTISNKKKNVFITLLVLMTFAALFSASYITNAMVITDNNNQPIVSTER